MSNSTSDVLNLTRVMGFSMLIALAFIAAAIAVGFFFGAGWGFALLAVELFAVALYLWRVLSRAIEDLKK